MEMCCTRQDISTAIEMCERVLLRRLGGIDAADRRHEGVLTACSFCERACSSGTEVIIARLLRTAVRGDRYAQGSGADSFFLIGEG
jgi:hypothetical protein